VLGLEVAVKANAEDDDGDGDEVAEVGDRGFRI
jgi:hypothetical protein